MALGEERQQLDDRRKQALQKGGPEHMAARVKKGALTARERVLGVLDPGTFVELDLFVDGVVAGHGSVAGRQVYIFSQGWMDDTWRGRAGEEHGPVRIGEGAAEKIVKVIDLALMSGAPLIGIYDGDLGSRGSAGRGWTDIFFHNVMASGLIPQISAVMGPCLGGAAYLPAVTDLVIMVKGSSQLSAAGSAVAVSEGLGEGTASASLATGRRVEAEAGGKVAAEVRVGASAGAGSTAPEDREPTLEELGGALVHSTRSGVAHVAADDEAQCLHTIRRLLSYLPQNNLENAPLVEAGDPVTRAAEELASLAASGVAGDMRDVIKHVVDGGEFLELLPAWAKNLVIGFARLGGRAVGIVANQPTCADGRLDNDAAVKGARFIRFCDAFNIPVVTFVDASGFAGGAEEEHGGAARHGAKLVCAYCEATVPKLTVITGKAHEQAYEVMGSKGVRTDFAFAWPAANLRITGMTGMEAEALLYAAAEAGLLDDIIQPEETRPRLIAALRACVSKREGRPPKKHGNIPL